jgi:hypothetical protein
VSEANDWRSAAGDWRTHPPLTMLCAVGLWPPGLGAKIGWHHRVITDRSTPVHQPRSTLLSRQANCFQAVLH